MPRVCLDSARRRINRITDFIRGEMKRRDLTQADLANVLNITQQGFSRKLKNGFTLEDIVRIFEFFKISKKEAGELLGYEE